jgi:nitrile hydratase beta subunit
MNGIHDMGGMHGLGPILHEADEPVFHERWEARMFGIAQAMTYPPAVTLDRWRFLAERMPPAAYLSQSYYERWYFICASALLEAGMATLAELSAGRAAPGSATRDDATRAEAVRSAVARDGKFSREAKSPPRFTLGQRVVTRNLHPTGHTRLPRFARGRVGKVQHWHGAYVFPDTSACGDGECPQHLYTIAFAASELWGPAAGRNDKVYLGLWDSYLDPA